MTSPTVNATAGSTSSSAREASRAPGLKIPPPARSASRSRGPLRHESVQGTLSGCGRFSAAANRIPCEMRTRVIRGRPPPADPLDAWVERRPELKTPGFWDLVQGNAEAWAREITAGPFWSEARRLIDAWRSDYRARKGADLLAEPGLRDFTFKSAKSCERKVRLMCGQRPEFQAFPEAGPPVPQIHDLVRTRIVCRYVDGVEFMADQISALAQARFLEPTRSREGRVEGYFAQHVNFSHEVFYRELGVPTATHIQCEIQLATELSTRMWDASHLYYEETRGELDDSHQWQWTPEDPKFIAYQLGHVMHLADGLLANLRDMSWTKKKDPDHDD